MSGWAHQATEMATDRYQKHHLRKQAYAALISAEHVSGCDQVFDFDGSDSVLRLTREGA
jgi:hypothetical protein